MRARVEVGGCGLGDVPDPDARTRRRLAKAEWRQKGVSPVVWRSSEPWVVAKAVLGFWAVAVVVWCDAGEAGDSI